MTTYTLPKQRQ